MTGPLKTGRIPARICPECNESFLPKRTDTDFCSAQCRAIKRKRDNHEKNARKLKNITCVICGGTFKQKRSNQECCSYECNDAKQTKKKSNERRSELNAERRVCKNRTCTKIFIPNRGNQVFCSESCADTTGKREYKERNVELTKLRERDRKRKKYQADEAYRESRKQKTLNRFHALTTAEKTERSRLNRAQRDPDALREYHRNYQQERSDNDIEFKITNRLRSRTRAAIRYGQGLKQKETLELLGCPNQKARQHIEEQFEEGMSWENWTMDGWHLDHIRPCISFDLRMESQQFVCFNYRNLMPVWSQKNLSKNDTYELQDEVAWVSLMRDLRYKGELFLHFEEGNGGL